VEGCSVDSAGSEQGRVAGSYEHSNEHLDSMKGRDVLHFLGNH